MKEQAAMPKGRIQSIRATDKPRGKGWIKDPKTGLWIRETKSTNTVVLAGISMAAKSIQYGNPDAGKTIRYLGVGTGMTLPSIGDTALVLEVSRIAIASWDNSGIASNPVVMMATTLFLTGEGNGNLMEVGLFVNSTGAPMYCRGLFGYGYITNATQASPCVIECVDHGLTDSDLVYISGVEGMTELNTNSYYVDVLTSSTFALYADEDLTTPIDSSAYGAYSDASPNTALWRQVVPKTTSETMTINYTLTFPAD
jgi:hypothetical protein